MTKTRARLLLAAALPLAAALAACEGGPAATDPDPVQPVRFVSARYTLARVAGKPLPAFYYDGGGTRGDYTGGSLQLNPDGSFASDYTVHFSSVRNGTPYDWQIRLAGQYEIRGESIRYTVAEVTTSHGTMPRPASLLGVIGGDTVTTLTHATETAVYVRQP